MASDGVLRLCASFTSLSRVRPGPSTLAAITTSGLTRKSPAEPFMRFKASRATMFRLETAARSLSTADRRRGSPDIQDDSTTHGTEK